MGSASQVTDSGGLEASGSFTITVRGAADQLSDLQARVTGVGPGKSLHNKIAAAATAVHAGDTGQACSILHAFINEVAAQAEKKLTASQAADLTAAAQRIRAIIGC